MLFGEVRHIYTYVFRGPWTNQFHLQPTFNNKIIIYNASTIYNVLCYQSPMSFYVIYRQYTVSNTQQQPYLLSVITRTPFKPPYALSTVDAI